MCETNTRMNSIVLLSCFSSVLFPCSKCMHFSVTAPYLCLQKCVNRCVHTMHLTSLQKCLHKVLQQHKTISTNKESSAPHSCSLDICFPIWHKEATRTTTVCTHVVSPSICMFTTCIETNRVDLRGWFCVISLVSCAHFPRAGVWQHKFRFVFPCARPRCSLFHLNQPVADVAR